MANNSMGRKAKKKPRFITPPNHLKTKVGGGGIPDRLIMKGQDHIESNPVDFAPFAREFLDKFDMAIKEARSCKDNESRKAALSKVIPPVMQIKAHGGMFRYLLLSHVADIILQFLEHVDQVNDDVLNIAAANSNCMNAIIKNGIQGDGGPEGSSIIRELQSACDRFYKKYGE